MPSAKSKQSLLADIKSSLNAGYKAIEAYASADESRRAGEAYVQVLSRVDREIRGWGDAFSFSDIRLPFHQIDTEIDKLLREFKGQANRIIGNASQDGKRRALGIALLKDTPMPSSERNVTSTAA